MVSGDEVKVGPVFHVAEISAHRGGARRDRTASPVVPVLEAGAGLVGGVVGDRRADLEVDGDALFDTHDPF